MSFDPEAILPPGAKIKVVGVGGGGGNAVNTMIRTGLEGVDFVTANTDVQALRFSLSPSKVQVGKELTKGLGAGADPDIGREAALEDRHEIQQFLEGADMVFITAGMGGGTGTGGASVVAQIAKELGALTVAVVTKPFMFEGKRRKRYAEVGIERLREVVDTLITIPNQKLLQVADANLSMVDAFKIADDVLVNAVRGISDIINIPGTVNVDFADVKAVMANMGQALMGIGEGEGTDRAKIAASSAIKSPLLDDIDIEGATGVLVNISAGENVTLAEVNEACSVVQDAAHEDANFIFGAVIDESLGDKIKVTVIATGFPFENENDESIITGTRQSGVLNQPLPSKITSPVSKRLVVSQEQTPISSTIEVQRPEQPVSPEQRAPIDPIPEVTPAATPTSEVIAPPQASMHHQPAAAVPSPEPVATATPAVASQAISSDVGEFMDLTDQTFQNIEQPSKTSEGLFDEPESNPTSELNAPSALATQQSLAGESGQTENQQVKVSQQPVTLEGATAFDTPLDDLFSNMDGVDDIDKRIDEAFEMAEQLRKVEPLDQESDNDLEIPAFLRSEIKDLPLD